MEIEAIPVDYTKCQEEALIVPVFEGEGPDEGLLADLDKLTGGVIRSVFEMGEFKGKKGDTVFLHRAGALAARRLMLYGAGKVDETTVAGVQKGAGACVRTLRKHQVGSAGFLLREKLSAPSLTQSLVEGAILGQVTGNLYGASNGHKDLTRLTIVPEEPIDGLAIEALARGQLMADATNFARLLGNEPANIMTPSELARRAAQMAEQVGLPVEILREEELRQKGFGALLAVSSGSAEPPTLTVLRYEPEAGALQEEVQKGELIALIGKGITFDSGGISIKPAFQMDEMKFDMCGGAAVIGAMQAIARLRPPIRVLGVIAASENLLSGGSYKPGDVVTGLGGKTIEIINTDAEGRMVLSDAITYAIQQGATQIIDAATLTGACVVAFAEVRAAIMGTDQTLIDELIRTGEDCGEKLWQLPIDPEYGEQIQSPIADIRNDGGRGAGAITAGMFLKLFAGSTPWAHLDIAGTAWLDAETPSMAKGATGFGVRTLANYVLNRGRR